MDMFLDVGVRKDDFDVATQLARLEGLGGGAVASFTGIVRNDDGVATLLLEHHPIMTERSMTAIAREAACRWPLLGIVMLHRVGHLAPGDRIVMVAAASQHRTAALSAVELLIDWLKTDSPFWKKETLGDGTTAGWRPGRRTMRRPRAGASESIASHMIRRKRR